MLQKNLSFRFPFFFILIFSTFCYTPQVFSYAPPEGLKGKIKKAKSFGEIFKLEKSIKLEPAKDGFVTRVNAMVITEKGDILVNDIKAGGADVLIFDKTGKFARTVAKKGSGPGEYSQPQSMASDSQGNIYIVDANKRQINVYDKNCKFKTVIHYTSNNQFIHVNSKKDFYLYMGMPLPMPGFKPYKCVTMHSPDGKKKTEFAELPAEIMKVKFYIHSDCMALDKNDNIYESNPLMPNIRKYDSGGNFIKEFGEKRIKMLTETDSKGKSYDFPRYIESFSILNDVIMLQFSDEKVDFYDTDGNLLNRNIPLDKRIACIYNNGIYAVEHKENQDNPTIHKYVIK